MGYKVVLLLLLLNVSQPHLMMSGREEQKDSKSGLQVGSLRLLLLLATTFQDIHCEQVKLVYTSCTAARTLVIALSSKK